MHKKVKFGVMYHTTRFSPEVWDKDFKKLSEAGFEKIVLWDEGSVFKNILEALYLCGKYSLKVYYCVFNPMYFAEQFPARKYKRYKCIGIDGAVSELYNPFNKQGRKRLLLPYLKNIVENIGHHEMLAGYFIDDTLDFDSIISYTGYDAVNFRKFLKTKYENIGRLNKHWRENCKKWAEIFPPRIMLTWRSAWRRMWDDWCEARQDWWVEWAQDVISVIRENESKRNEIVLGDDWYSLRFGRDVAGGFTPKIVGLFDSFSFDYTAGLDYLDGKMTNIDRDIAMVRDLAGRKKIYMFLKTASKHDKPFPKAEEIIAQTKRAIQNNVDEVYYYVYRTVPGNYAEKNCLSRYPKVLDKLSKFMKK